MSLKTLGAKVAAKFAKETFVLRQNSPTILMGVGALGLVTTAVLASRATLKMSDVLTKADEEITEAENGDQDAKKSSVFSTQIQTAITIAKLYTPAVLVGAVSLAAMTGSHLILQRRNAALGAAYAVLNQSYKGYRARVVADQGADKDREYFYGAVEKEIVEEGPDGPVTKTAMVIDTDAINAGGSGYARAFNEYNPNYSGLPGVNANFLRGQGYVFLNDVYELLGFEKTKAGQRVGWTKNADKDGSGDGFIDFGIWTANTDGTGGKQWILRGSTDAILLDFNVDGEIDSLLREI
jgi:hypothetical protein